MHINKTLMQINSKLKDSKKMFAWLVFLLNDHALMEQSCFTAASDMHGCLPHAIRRVCISDGLEVNSWKHLVWKEKKRERQRKMEESRCGLRSDSAQLCWLTNQAALNTNGSKCIGSFHRTGGLCFTHACTHTHMQQTSLWHFTDDCFLQ